MVTARGNWGWLTIVDVELLLIIQPDHDWVVGEDRIFQFRNTSWGPIIRVTMGLIHRPARREFPMLAFPDDGCSQGAVNSAGLNQHTCRRLSWLGRKICGFQTSDAGFVEWSSFSSETTRSGVRVTFIAFFFVSSLRKKLKGPLNGFREKDFYLTCFRTKSFFLHSLQYFSKSCFSYRSSL